MLDGQTQKWVCFVACDTILLMIIIVLVVVGLCLGSFVNALVWRIHEQETLTSKKSSKKAQNDLSITTGRSMCPNCKHELKAKDLVPLFSWLSLKGKCRYCHKPISWQYPVVELITAILFKISYMFWPVDIVGPQVAVFVIWLILLVGYMALIVYDLKWMILPNRIVYPLSAIAGIMAVIQISISPSPVRALINTVLAVAVGGGIFYLLYQLSDGKWIGGGDVKLGWLLGLVAGTPARSLLIIFLAGLLGSLVSLPLIATGKLKRTTVIPFGPFLIVAAFIVQLSGASILHWYQYTLLMVNY